MSVTFQKKQLFSFSKNNAESDHGIGSVQIFQRTFKTFPDIHTLAIAANESASLGVACSGTLVLVFLLLLLSIGAISVEADNEVGRLVSDVDISSSDDSAAC